MLRYKLEPNRQLIDHICQLAIARGEVTLKAMEDSGIPLNVELNEESAVERLAKNVATLPAARFLVEKFGGSKAWLVYGLVGLNRIDEARNLVNLVNLHEVPEDQEQEDMVRKFYYALGVYSRLDLALEYINQALPVKRNLLRFWFITGLGRAGNTDLATPMIEAHRNNPLLGALIIGLGRSGLSDLALEAIAGADISEQEELLKILVALLGFSNSPHAKNIIANASVGAQTRLRSEYVFGLSQAWHVKEALAEINAAPQGEQANLVSELIRNLRGTKYFWDDLDISFKFIVAIADERLRKLAAVELLSSDDDKLLNRVERISQCAQRFSLDYDYAKTLADHWTATINLFLQMTVTSRRHQLPLEVFAKVASYILNASDHDTLFIINAVFDKLHANFSAGVKEQFYLKFQQGLFSQKQYDKNCEYEDACYKRRHYI